MRGAGVGGAGTLLVTLIHLSCDFNAVGGGKSMAGGTSGKSRAFCEHG